MFTHTVIPLDGSKLAQSVIDAIDSIPFPDDHHITLVTVHDPLVGRQFEEFAAAEHISVVEAIRRYHDDVITDLAARGHSVSSSQVTATDAADGILEAVSGLGATAVIMSSHGRSGVRRWMLGSVAEKLVRSLDCPIVIVPVR